MNELALAASTKLFLKAIPDYYLTAPGTDPPFWFQTVHDSESVSELPRRSLYDEVKSDRDLTESDVWIEGRDLNHLIRLKGIFEGNLWQFVNSGWKSGDRVRIGPGSLLTTLLAELYSLSRRRAVSTMRLIHYDKGQGTHVDQTFGSFKPKSASTQTENIQKWKKAKKVYTTHKAIRRIQRAVNSGVNSGVKDKKKQKRVSDGCLFRWRIGPLHQYSYTVYYPNYDKSTAWPVSNTSAPLVHRESLLELRCRSTIRNVRTAYVTSLSPEQTTKPHPASLLSPYSSPAYSSPASSSHQMNAKPRKLRESSKHPFYQVYQQVKVKLVTERLAEEKREKEFALGRYGSHEFDDVSIGLVQFAEDRSHDCHQAQKNIPYSSPTQSVRPHASSAADRPGSYSDIPASQKPGLPLDFSPRSASHPPVGVRRSLRDRRLQTEPNSCSSATGEIGSSSDKTSRALVGPGCARPSSSVDVECGSEGSMVFTQPNYTAARALCYTGHKTNSRQLLRAQIQRMKKALLTLHPLLEEAEEEQCHMSAGRSSNPLLAQQKLSSHRASAAAQSAAPVQCQRCPSIRLPSINDRSGLACPPSVRWGCKLSPQRRLSSNQFSDRCDSSQATMFENRRPSSFQEQLEAALRTFTIIKEVFLSSDGLVVSSLIISRSTNGGHAHNEQQIN